MFACKLDTKQSEVALPLERAKEAGDGEGRGKSEEGECGMGRYSARSEHSVFALRFA